MNDEEDATVPVVLEIGGPEIGRAYIYEQNGELVASIYLEDNIDPNTISVLSIYATPDGKRND